MATGATRRLAALALATAMAATACARGGWPGGGGGGHHGPPFRGEIDLTLTTDPATCDPLGGDRCLLPFPNDHFTVEDPATATGRRVDLAPEATPANRAGVHVDPTELNRNDGFSPGSAIAVLLPGVDPVASGLAPITDMAASLDRDAPVVVLDADTGERHPYWAELDSRAPDPQHQLLFVRPARNFLEGHRYVVAIRGVVDGAGQPIAPTDVFRAYRDRLRSDVPEVEDRRAHMEDLFRTLQRKAHVRPSATSPSPGTSPWRAARTCPNACSPCGTTPSPSWARPRPAFSVTSVAPSTRANLATEVQGTFQVPSYLTGDGSPGTVLNNGDGPGSSPIPERNGDYTARFICTIPQSATNPDGTANPTQMMLYGHGLLGSAREVYGASSRYASVANVTTCATWWIGMSEDDYGAVLNALGRHDRVPDDARSPAAVAC